MEEKHGAEEKYENNRADNRDGFSDRGYHGRVILVARL